MKRYFGLFTKNQSSVVHKEDSMPNIVADVVEPTEAVATHDEVAQVVEPEVHAVEDSAPSTDAEKPKRRRSRKSTASSSPSETQEVGDT